MNNGGFDQYFLNTEGAFAAETAVALEKLELRKYSTILDKALFASQNDDDGQLDLLDEEFYELDQDETEGDAHPITRLATYMEKDVAGWDGFAFEV